MGAIFSAQAVPLADPAPAEPIRPGSARCALITLALLLASQFATFVPLPGLEPIRAMALTDHYHYPSLDLLSGGAWRHVAVTMLGLAPYFAAWTIIRLLIALSRGLRSLEQEEAGRRRINRWLRAGTLALALSGGYAIALLLESHGDAGGELSGLPLRFLIAGTLAAGTMFLVWLAELITARGLGNGAPLIIASGIAANLPAAFGHLAEAMRVGFVPALAAIGFALAAVAVIAATVAGGRSRRRLLVGAPLRRGGRAESHHLALAPCAGGIMPAICAAPLLPEIGQDWARWQTLTGPPIYLLVFVGATILFGIQASAPTETAAGLKQWGGFIPGIRPGRNTADYLRYVTVRIAGFSGVLLALAAMLPNMLVPEYLTTGFLSGSALVVLSLVITDTIAPLDRSRAAPTPPRQLRRGTAVVASAFLAIGLIYYGSALISLPTGYEAAAAVLRQSLSKVQDPVTPKACVSYDGKDFPAGSVDDLLGRFPGLLRRSDCPFDADRRGFPLSRPLRVMYIECSEVEAPAGKNAVRVECDFVRGPLNAEGRLFDVSRSFLGSLSVEDLGPRWVS